MKGTDEEREEKRLRLRDALAGFDAATIATTHQFCQLVLRSLGVAGDTDAGVTLVENLDQLVGEIVDDLYLQRFGDVKDTPVLTRAQALELAHEVVRNPRTRLTPLDPPADDDRRRTPRLRRRRAPRARAPQAAARHPRLR